MINRGWVPLKKMDAGTRAQGQVEGEVEVVGVVRHTDKGAFLGDNDKKSRVWQSRDLYGKIHFGNEWRNDFLFLTKGKGESEMKCCQNSLKRTNSTESNDSTF